MGNIKRISAREARELLPWYVTGKLSTGEKTQVELWLEQAPDARVELAEWKALRDEVLGQKSASPSKVVFSRITTRIHSQPKVRPLNITPWMSWSLGAALTLLVMVILWISVRPGVALEWAVNENSLANFRIYRSELGRENYRLIAQVPAQSGALEYSFVDTLLIPGRSYIYRVEGMEGEGFIAVSQAIASSPLAALPGQLAILFTSLVMGYCGITLLQYWPVIWSKSLKRPIIS
jgi:hypothetical protein